MSLNSRSQIVPLGYVNRIIRRVSKDQADLIEGYDRVQLLTERDYLALVDEGHDRSYIKYGELSKDFPLCMDFADICANDVKRLAIKKGLAVRPCMGTVEYTMNERKPHSRFLKRHAINFCVTVDKRILWLEPQSGLWLPEPDKLLTLDAFYL